MFRGNISKEPPHKILKEAGEAVNQPRIFNDPGDPEPKGNDAQKEACRLGRRRQRLPPSAKSKPYS
jgi:hypothetical protein